MTSADIPFHRFSRKTRVVFFTGAGISAESNISTFRDPDGHWAKHDPMKLASPQGFRQDPDLVLSWYASRREDAMQAEPNPAHLAITSFQKLFKHSFVITQNVDGLHHRAGNQNILELHGNLHRQKCFDCGLALDVSGSGVNITTCECGGLPRPDVVWFGESLPQHVLQQAFQEADHAELFFAIGTSTQIYPASQLPYEAQRQGAYVIEINPASTPFTEKADVALRGKAGEILPKLFEEFYASLN